MSSFYIKMLCISSINVSPRGSLEGLMLKCQYLATWCEDLTHWKRPWCWERLRAGGEGDDRGWDGWMASPTKWTWVWVDSGSWWWTGGLACWGSWGHRIGHDWATELNWTELNVKRVAALSNSHLRYCLVFNFTNTSEIIWSCVSCILLGHHLGIQSIN